MPHQLLDTVQPWDLPQVLHCCSRRYHVTVYFCSNRTQQRQMSFMKGADDPPNCRYGGVELLMDLVHTTPSSEVLAAAAKALQAMMASPEVQVTLSTDGLVIRLWLSFSCSQPQADDKTDVQCRVLSIHTWSTWSALPSTTPSFLLQTGSILAPLPHRPLTCHGCTNQLLFTLAPCM